MTRNKYVTYQFVLVVAIFGILGSTFYYLIFGTVTLSDIIRNLLIGVIVEAIFLANSSSQKRQLATQQLDAVRNELVRLGYTTHETNGVSDKVYKEYYYRRYLLWWDEALLDTRHGHAEIRYSSILQRQINSFLDTL
jgi:hypothetical protein